MNYCCLFNLNAKEKCVNGLLINFELIIDSADFDPLEWHHPNG